MSHDQGSGTVIELAPAYLRFRESHHAVARWFAMGCTISKVCDLTGYSRRRLQILLFDPAFKNLISDYKNNHDPEWRQDIDTYDRLQRHNMIQAEMQISERLEAADEGGDPLPVAILDRISQSRADRTGYSKHSKHTIEHSFAERLDAAIERSNKARLIEAQPLANRQESPPATKPAAMVESRPSTVLEGGIVQRRLK